MIKRFCDICGQEVKDDVRLLRSEKVSHYALCQGTKLSLEIIVAKDGKMNSLDDRPRQAVQA